MDYGYFHALQLTQRQFDVSQPVVEQTLASQLKGYVLHLSGKNAQLVSREGRFSEPLLADMFSTALSAANAMNMDLSKAVVRAEHQNESLPLGHCCTVSVGRMAKAAEELDHASKFPSRQVLEQETALLAYRLDCEFNKRLKSTHAVLKTHLAAAAKRRPHRPEKIPAVAMDKRGLD